MSVAVHYVSKGADKSQVVVDQMRLGRAAAVVRAKAFWKEQLDRLKQRLEA